MALVEHPPSVCLVVERDGELVLLRQRRPGADELVVELPGGAIEPGETTVTAADRELAEECGLACDGWTELGSFWVAPAYSTERVVVLAGRASGNATAAPDADESLEPFLSPAETARSLVTDSVSLAALGLWERVRGAVS